MGILGEEAKRFNSIDRDNIRIGTNVAISENADAMKAIEVFERGAVIKPEREIDPNQILAEIMGESGDERPTMGKAPEEPMIFNKGFYDDSER